jgi:uracil-DNA glycosylase family 4
MDSFSNSVAATLPLLRRIRDQLGSSPTASAAALDRVAASARDSRSVSRRMVTPNAPVPLAPVSDPDATWTWEALEQAVTTCTKCPHLVVSRKHVVFGVGRRDADLVFVGEAPGADEDLEGEPFVGKVGELLSKILTAMNLTRDDVFIANVLKCRPDMPPGTSGNRKPRADEMATCLPWLIEQIHLIQPRVIVALGATAVQGLLDESRPIGALRGHWLDYRNIPVMPTYHPAYLLRNQSISEKRKVWEDMLAVMERLEMPISDKQRRFFSA